MCRNHIPFQPVCSEPELITFTQSTFYFPLLYLALLFLPTIVYIEIISWRKYGAKKLTEQIVESTVFSVFAAVTNISLFEKSPDIPNPDKQVCPQRRSHSEPFNRIRPSQNQRSRSLNFLPQLQPNLEQDQSFSRSQSNILYILYLFGTTIIFCMDLAYQIVKAGVFTTSGLAFFSLFLCNIVLWMDFNFQLYQQTKPHTRDGMFEKLMDGSSEILVCVLIAPLYWCSAKLR